MDDETLNQEAPDETDAPLSEDDPTESEHDSDLPESEEEANERVNAQHDAVFEASREGGPVLDPKTLLPVENPPVPRAAIPPFVSHSQAIEELRAKREACPHAVNHQQYIREGQVCACEREYSAEVIAAARS